MTDTGKISRLRYEEGCLGAHALNFIGDRWALLVVRELMFAPKRFQMIRAGLPGVTASVLTQRLTQLVQAGVVAHDDVLGVYALTDAGRALHPVLRELCRWALVMPGHDPRKFISISALMISISATVDSAAAAGSPLRAGFVSGKEGFEVTLSAQGMPQVRAARAPQADFVLEGLGNALAAAVYGPGPVTLASAGLIGLRGDRNAAQQFTAFFRLEPQTSSSSDSPEETEQALGASST
ncbi:MULTISPECIES: winged helix-turn-helix transcriptional regulator [Paracoccus]|jgi:DNA-binding HxlR family transcriptional regulator|uniref:Transcriptional regulator, HxlR family n=1 Tax=Paracoccus denitrificans (strain Pd 1222) TaxID=318586 RepID=A1B4H3_PARDP|nr:MULTISPECIES: winged helix-turn-helix transcriptional regulator [Paracoccus]ABL70417.1 transcriptional regulator, HxlR family [Paracoccus denitrificans PD1222]MBB4627326.1 DNA-binding HxlR family transcriptional regulator [Paracoccus denitrificans]MCU7427902.1 winged helix-turn-helix transcriptional regulator [Paracoccus denitrificans]MDK8874151.1 winged helix-turn-helix transcriptional regulator [Paracoccus sp. SSJ]QAR25759.1 transcriptional regulator [Paracoccus denitrificans]